MRLALAFCLVLCLVLPGCAHIEIHDGFRGEIVNDTSERHAYNVTVRTPTGQQVHDVEVAPQGRLALGRLGTREGTYNVTVVVDGAHTVTEQRDFTGRGGPGGFHATTRFDGTTLTFWHF